MHQLLRVDHSVQKASDCRVKRRLNLGIHRKMEASENKNQHFRIEFLKKSEISSALVIVYNLFPPKVSLLSSPQCTRGHNRSRASHFPDGPALLPDTSVHTLVINFTPPSAPGHALDGWTAPTSPCLTLTPFLFLHLPRHNTHSPDLSLHAAVLLFSWFLFPLISWRTRSYSALSPLRWSIQSGAFLTAYILHHGSLAHQYSLNSPYGPKQAAALFSRHTVNCTLSTQH